MPEGLHVSVVLCTYNRASSLRLTLNALGAQVTPSALSWELVVVDNHSTDQTRDVIADFASTARIAVEPRHAAEQGLSHARNVGIRHSRGDIVAFTDDDVDPSVDWVATIASVIAEHGADIVGGRILPAWTGPRPVEARSWLTGPLSILDHASPGQVTDPYGEPAVWGANMAFRRIVFDRIGMFDTRRGRVGAKLYGGEELELLRRALSAGHRIVYDPRIVVAHRVGPDRTSIRYLSRYFFQRAEREAFLRSADPEQRNGLTVLARLRRLLRGAVRREPGALPRWFRCCAAAGTAWGTCKRHVRSLPRADR